MQDQAHYQMKYVLGIEVEVKVEEKDLWYLV
jgi:hypothetical protein